jgi:class 3 adenylate cyclase
MQIHIKNSEVIILLIVSLMALAANLPDGAIGHLIDRNLLLITLAVTVVIALFRYLRLMLFLTVSVLAIGANLPDQLASQLGISQLAMIVASGVLVLVALLYKLYHLHVVKNIPDYQEDTVCYRHDSYDSRNDVITAIITGNTAALHQLLISDVEINFSQNGHVPLYLAIEKGYADLVLLLLIYGAKFRVRNKAGQTPLQFALFHKDLRIAKILHYAARQNLSIQNKAIFPNQRKKVAVLFADICGSTALYDQLGNETALNVITRTLNILTQEVAAHKGVLIKTIGDEIMCTFPSVAAATLAACAMHSALDAARPGGEHPVYVRIGFHYGEVIHKASDVFGDTVNVAARVAAITRARQIMTTQTVIDSLPSGLADKVRPVTRAVFHGKQDSLAVFQILWGPENTIMGRIGESTYRKSDADIDSFSNLQDIDHLAPPLDLQAL